MLRIPSKGLQNSVNRHNCRTDVLSDWIEGSALFTQTRISKVDVLDMLLEEQVYRNEDFAWEFILNVWDDLRYRVEHGKNCALRIDLDGVTPEGHWEKFPAYSFCLALALRDWCSCGDNSHHEQGELFERLTECSLVARGWRSKRTGWASKNAAGLPRLVEEISSHIKEPLGGNIEEWLPSRGKDAGLDLICDQLFSDDRGGRPLYFFQCASGRQWKDKTNTPDLQLWAKLIDFSNSPLRGFSLPYVLSERREFRRVANSINGILIDRLRLIAPLAGDSNQVPSELESDLKNWLTPRIEALTSESHVNQIY